MVTGPAILKISMPRVWARMADGAILFLQAGTCFLALPPRPIAWHNHSHKSCSISCSPPNPDTSSWRNTTSAKRCSPISPRCSELISRRLSRWARRSYPCLVFAFEGPLGRQTDRGRQEGLHEMDQDEGRPLYQVSLAKRVRGVFGEPLAGGGRPTLYSKPGATSSAGHVSRGISTNS